jgi:hypothetical protein
MGSFFLWFDLYLVFSGVFIVLPVHVRKRKGRLKPATTAQFFLDRLPCVVGGTRVKQKAATR